MTKSKIVLVFTSFTALWILRLLTLVSPLPSSWTPDSTVRITARVTEQIQHTDSYTIIRYGRWVIKLRGYQQITPGLIYTFAGKVKVELLMGKISKIEMVDPSFVAKNEDSNGKVKISELLIVFLGDLRQRMVKSFQKMLPEPHASLSAGILLGVKANLPYDFYQELVSTGTMHVIAASGYNVSVVVAAMMFPLLKLMKRRYAMLIGIIGIWIYVVVAGSSAAIVRAGIMGGLTLLAYAMGRSALAKRLLWITAAIMLMIDPLMLWEVGFQLSIVATAGLLYMEPWIKDKLQRIVLPKSYIQAFLANYLYPTLAASISTLPIIAWHFGRISYISPIVNIFILPVIPLIMLLSSLYLALSWIPVVHNLAAMVLYVPLQYVITVIDWFAG